MKRNPRFQIAITDFALPVPRRGSIDTHSGYGPLPQQGNELHLLVQAQRQQEFPEYEPEVRITHCFSTKRNSFLLTGRMDGVFRRNPVVIEEIKSCFNLKDLAIKLREDSFHPYCLQLQTYAYLQWLKTSQIPQTQFLLISSRNQEQQIITLPFLPETFEEWLALRLHELDTEVERLEKSRKRRLKISKTLAFPFIQPRPGQMELKDKITEALTEHKFLLLQAPTGLGKTAGVLYPVLVDSLERGQRLIYVTPKNSQQPIVEETVSRFQQNGSAIKSLSMTAKHKMCFKNETICNPSYCEFAKDHYTKVDQHGLKDKMRKKKRLTNKTFTKLGKVHEVCPFELQQEMLKETDIVICDYNYVFSPRNKLSALIREPLQEKKRKPNLIIDEAHNLHSRAASYFSPSLSSEQLKKWQAEVNFYTPANAEKLRSLLQKALDFIHGSKPSCGGDAQVKLEVSEFLDFAGELRAHLARYLESADEPQKRDIFLRLSDLWSEFALALQMEGPQFFTTYSEKRGNAELKITCCDASEQISQCYKEFHRVVGFSATLKPFHYYAQLSGMSQGKLFTSEFQSPFPAQNRKVLVVPQVSTKYKERDRNSQKIAEAIERILPLNLGNYFIFFPSFEFLEKIHRLVKLPRFSILKQERDMKAKEVREILATLKENSKPTVVFAVQGGVFAEGVDYPGKMLIGAVIVGPSLPSFDLERELMRAYFEKNFGSGFDYAYTYPAMARVIQSAGRVIRSASDRGLLVLLDQRFVQDAYVKSMPIDWHQGSIENVLSASLLSDISAFWQNSELNS